jgi:hypothetical protein
MKRGGLVPMLVEGTYHTDSEGSGEPITVLEIYKVSFENHPKKDMSHIVDMDKLKGCFREEVEKLRAESEVVIRNSTTAWFIPVPPFIT